MDEEVSTQEDYPLSDNSDSSSQDNLSSVSKNILSYLYNAEAYKAVPKNFSKKKDNSTKEYYLTDEEISNMSSSWKNKYQSWQVDEVDITKLDRQHFLLFLKYLLEYEKTAEEQRDRDKFLNTGSKENNSGVINNLQIEEFSRNSYGKFTSVFISTKFPDDLPSHCIKRGDVVSVFISCVGDDNHCVDGVVSEVNPTVISVTVDFKFSYEENAIFSLMHHPSLENYKRVMEAIDNIAEYTGAASRLCEVIFGEKSPLPPLNTIPPQLCDRNDQLMFFNRNLDESQKDAVEFVIRQQDLAVIHGPPGTGKTTTIVEIINQHVSLGNKVLCLAPSNLGIDNLVERLDRMGQRVVRLGHPARTTPETLRHTLDAHLNRGEYLQIVHEIRSEIGDVHQRLSSFKGKKTELYRQLKKLHKELNRRQDKETKSIIRNADVVLGTLLSVNDQGIFRFLHEDHFGLTVIDECSQGMEAACYPGVMRAPKLLLVGDHKQLPPTVLHPKATYLLNSLMERMICKYGDDVVRVLRTQYRMHEDIMQWSSDAMYEGKLEAAASVKSHLLSHLPKVEHNELTSCPLTLVDTTGCPGFEETELHGFQIKESKCNEGEARLVSCLVTRLLDSGLSERHVAVITPYSKQVKLVRSLVHKLYPEVEVHTVDGFQGREKEAVILSLVRSNARGEIGFLSEDRRLNVAVTRAKRHLSVICDSGTLQSNTFLNQFVNYMTDKANLLPVDQLEKQSCANLPVDFSQMELTSLKSEAKGNRNRTEKMKSFGEMEEDVEERRERKTNKYLSELKEFVNSKHIVKSFSKHLQSFDRMIIHDIAEELQLEHYSVGEGGNRRIIVRKYDPKERSEKESPKRNSDEMDEDLEKLKPFPKSSRSVPLERENTTTTHCTLCGKDVLCSSYASHRLHCERKERQAIAKQQKEAADKLQTCDSKESNNKKKKKKPQVQQEEEDFDAVVASFTEKNKKCNFGKCKDTNSLLFQTCDWCHSYYCLKHFLAEVHGCGKHAKQHARETVKKEGVIYPGSGVPSKLPPPDKKAQLQRSLQGKVGEMEKRRKANKNKK